jgi:hypothetical protein
MTPIGRTWPIHGCGVVSAVLYMAGLGLLAVGSVGAFLWTPVLWCAIAGLVVIPAALAVTGGRL